MADELIPTPNLDISDEEMLAAQAIAYTVGSLTSDRVNSQIQTLRNLLDILAGTNAPVPICAELTNANPSSPHTVLLEAQAWLLAQIARRINQVPRQNQIEFARLFGIELRAATAATTTLLFTFNGNTTVPQGTQISTSDGKYIFTTDADATSNLSQSTHASVTATRTVTGHTQLLPGTLTKLVSGAASVVSVINQYAVDSGADAETIDSALQRARNYQQRGERIVSSRDLETAVLDEALNGNGIVRAFAFVKSGDWTTMVAGYTTLVVMTNAGFAVSDDVRAKINALIQQTIGNEFVYVADPQFVDFNVGVSVRLTGISSQTATLAAIERNLRAFYAPSASGFGRPILRAEIISIIEGTTGVQRIQAQPLGLILASPLVDTEVAPYMMPRVVSVNIAVVL